MLSDDLFEAVVVFAAEESSFSVGEEVLPCFVALLPSFLLISETRLSFAEILLSLEVSC